MELRLEDLLQSQYNGVQVITLFDMAKVNVNLLIFLLNKKYVSISLTLGFTSNWRRIRSRVYKEFCY